MGRSKLETTPCRSQLMKRVKQADTPPEKAVRRALSALGVRYRLNAKGLPGTPDIVNRARRWAIFVHGCYWHAHEGCPRWRLPKRNREFWAEKFEANRKRDRQKIDELENLGFSVLVVWQCELEVEVQLRERLDRWVGELL